MLYTLATWYILLEKCKPQLSSKSETELPEV